MSKYTRGSKPSARTTKSRSPIGFDPELFGALGGVRPSEAGLTKPQIIADLTRSPHGDLAQYVGVSLRAAHEDPDFFSHLIAWNHVKGEIRDAKVALPMLQLAALKAQGTVAARDVFLDNALAHLADLTPRLFVRALEFGRAVQAPSRMIRRLAERYVRDLEAKRSDWENAALQHPVSMRTLYARFHLARPDWVREAFRWTDKSGARPLTTWGKFQVLRDLPSMSALQISGAIASVGLPWLIVRGVLGARVKEPDVLLALVQRMTAADLVTNTKWLMKAGLKDHAAARAAYDQALDKAGRKGRSRGTTLKAGTAAKAMEAAGDTQTAGKLKALQERQLDHLKTIEGNWLVLGDQSSSMVDSIQTAKLVASVLGRLVTGSVHLVFFNTSPRTVGNVQGKTLEEIEALSRTITATGGTHIGTGLAWAQDKKLDVDGVAIVSDGGDNHPWSFAQRYLSYCKVMQKTPTVYFYKLPGDPDSLTPQCASAGIDLQTIDLRGGVDRYSLPNVVATMRVGRYDLLDDILATPLRRLDEVLERTTRMEVMPHAHRHDHPVAGRV